MIAKYHNEVTHPGKADFVTQVVKATNAILSIFVVVILDKAEAVATLAQSRT